MASINNKLLRAAGATSIMILAIAQMSWAHGHHRPGVPYYFANWGSTHIPVKPLKELTEEEADSRHGYYVAYFDKHGKLVSFIKYIEGRKDWQEQYDYQPNGKVRRRQMIKVNGEVTTQYFDPHGKPIKQIN
jgi:antitoxin component YwqK of YwqJK toxin-antitoxin module